MSRNIEQSRGIILGRSGFIGSGPRIEVKSSVHMRENVLHSIMHALPVKVLRIIVVDSVR